MRVVLVLGHLAASILTLPGHGAIADTDVALRGYGGRLLTKIPVMQQNNKLVSNMVAIVRYSVDCIVVGSGSA